jgi:hypothetical protein
MAARARPAHSHGAANWSRYNEIVVIDAPESLLGRGVSLPRALIAKGYGWADRESRVPSTERTVYPVGSLSKQITGRGRTETRRAGAERRLRFDQPTVPLSASIGNGASFARSDAAFGNGPA